MRDSPESNIEIRLSLPQDAQSISSALFKSFVEYKSLYTPEGFAATTPTAEQIENRLNEGPVWVALLDGNIVGTVSAVEQPESVYVRGIAVLPAARGQRIGELLMGQIESFAASRGCGRLFLSTTPFLKQAITLYEQLGFRRTDEGPHDLFGTALFTMEKWLAAATR